MEATRKVIAMDHEPSTVQGQLIGNFLETAEVIDGAVIADGVKIGTNAKLLSTNHTTLYSFTSTVPETEGTTRWLQFMASPLFV